MRTRCSRNARLGRILLVYLSTGVAVLVTLAVVLAHLNRFLAEEAVGKKLAELETAGVPATLERVNRRYHDHGQDANENAAPLYEEGFALTVMEDRILGELRDAMRPSDLGVPLAPETVEMIREIAGANQAAIALFKEASLRPYVRFDLDFTLGADLLIPHVRQLRHGAYLLAADAILSAVDGDPLHAAESVATIHRLARHISEEPILISQLTQIVMETIGRVALERVLAKVELPPDALAGLQDQLKELETGPRMEPAIGTELAFGGWIYSQFGSDWTVLIEDHKFENNPFFLFYRWSGMMARDQDFYLGKMMEYLHAVKLPFEERVRVQWPEEEEATGPFAARLIAEIALPTLHRVMESDNRAVTFLRATRVALAAEQYRMEYGRFPANQEELVPDYLNSIPADPYAEDLTFQWVRDHDCFFVRSVMVIDGRDGGDDWPIQFRLPVR